MPMWFGRPTPVPAPAIGSSGHVAVDGTRPPCAARGFRQSAAKDLRGWDHPPCRGSGCRTVTSFPRLASLLGTAGGVRANASLSSTGEFILDLVLATLCGTDGWVRIRRMAFRAFSGSQQS
ncbi:hypothetical protein ColTof4_12465 [Colletotrichum tofieldiae]|nr:hypothetical protein ColTof3_06583 [Colletotrichum tofieldiae]GKT80042.1 hypothetical protein ColTof4_12465 [Colletotrichum tofieldiae]